MRPILALLAVSLVAAQPIGQAQTLILADDFNLTGSGTGFALGAGVNTGINPPTTRLTGTAASNLRYLHTATAKAGTAYTITDNRLAVAAAANSGRFTYSADGTSAFDFAAALGIGSATPVAPVTYDITLSLANNSAGIQRFSFALATEENNANFWDFGLQLYRAVATDNFYTIQKRIDTASSGGATDLNLAIGTTAASTYGTELSFLLRITDAGAETTAYNSRLQISLDGGGSWIYDTSTDSDLPNGWRLDGSARFLTWDQAAQAAATYDNFSLTVIPEPTSAAIGLLGGLFCLTLRQRAKR